MKTKRRRKTSIGSIVLGATSRRRLAVERMEDRLMLDGAFQGGMDGVLYAQGDSVNELATVVEAGGEFFITFANVQAAWTDRTVNASVPLSSFGNQTFDDIDLTLDGQEYSVNGGFDPTHPDSSGNGWSTAVVNPRSILGNDLVSDGSFGLPDSWVDIRKVPINPIPVDPPGWAPPSEPEQLADSDPGSKGLDEGSPEQRVEMVRAQGRSQAFELAMGSGWETDRGDRGDSFATSVEHAILSARSTHRSSSASGVSTYQQTSTSTTGARQTAPVATPATDRERFSNPASKPEQQESAPKPSQPIPAGPVDLPTFIVSARHQAVFAEIGDLWNESALEEVSLGEPEIQVVSDSVAAYLDRGRQTEVAALLAVVLVSERLVHRRRQSAEQGPTYLLPPRRHG